MQDVKTKTEKLPDIRILNEDDTHIVIAVRLEKTRLTKNLPFIAALCDCLQPLALALFGGLTAFDFALDRITDEVGALFFLT